MSGKELKKIISINDLTYEQAAKLLQISRGTLINWIQKDKLSEKIILKIQQLIQSNKLQSECNFFPKITQQGSNNNNVLINSHRDQRSYYRNSPEVLRTQIDELDRMIQEKELRIKEKDAQIKEKDAQINKLLEIMGK